MLAMLKIGLGLDERWTKAALPDYAWLYFCLAHDTSSKDV